jgi:DNA modification methylase
LVRFFHQLIRIVNHTKRGKFVYDAFLGSGTTLMAAEMSGRVCFGLELDPKYVDVTIERWQKLTGKPATLDGASGTFHEVQLSRRPKT